MPVFLDCYMASQKEQKARKNLLRKGEDPTGIPIEGYEFNQGVNYPQLMKQFQQAGFQASNFGKAVETIQDMIKKKAFIYVGYTSNMVSSGNREIIRWLVEHKKVDVLVTTCGGIEEDILKCFGSFVLGSFRADGSVLRKRGINRIGNIFVSNNLYVKFEQFLQPILEELWQAQGRGETVSPSDLVWKMGEKINNPQSICYWAWKNKIRLFCPAITDGAIGDNLYFFSFKRPDFRIDVVRDAKLLNDTTMGIKKAGVLILGTGVIKHHILNATMLRNGAEYAVYINSAPEFDGSDSGAEPEEAKSWGKIIGRAGAVKVVGDATILFPLLVAETFAQQNKKTK